MVNQKMTLVQRRRKGAAIIYLTVSMTTFVAFAMIAVDLGRMQLAKSELQSMTDAAARYGVQGLKNMVGGQSAAAGNVQQVINENTVAGMRVTFDQNSDLTMGTWNSTNKTFTTTTDPSAANAIRVTLGCRTARGSGVPVAFGRLFGINTFDLSASSIAMITQVTSQSAYNYTVPATSNPWLAGSPRWTVANPYNPANNPDYAGYEYTDNGTSSNGAFSSSNLITIASADYSSKKSSPIKAGGISVTPGATMTFDSINGGANNFSSSTLYNGDGNLDWVISNYVGAENGKSDIICPINAVVAVFLNGSNPAYEGAAPDTLDFSTASSRDFTTLSPQLRQTFYIGDGRTSNGEVQRFIIPPGATRMYLGTMDGWEWNNNVGQFYVSAHVIGRVTTVK